MKRTNRAVESTGSFEAETVVRSDGVIARASVDTEELFGSLVSRDLALVNVWKEVKIMNNLLLCLFSRFPYAAADSLRAKCC